MNEHLQFLQGFFKNPLKVGAIAPSSSDLALKMIEGVKPDENRRVLEIGCGTGAITKFLQEIIPSRNLYLGIEIDPDFVNRLEKDFPKLDFVCGDACEAKEILAERDFGKVGYIISGLPFVVLPPEVSEGILQEVDKLMQAGCLFRTFQYAHGYHLPLAKKFRQKLNEKYGTVERKLTGDEKRSACLHADLENFLIINSQLRITNYSSLNNLTTAKNKSLNILLITTPAEVL